MENLTLPPQKDGGDDVSDWYANTKSLAQKTASIIKAELNCLEEAEPGEPAGDARIKAFLSLTKAVQSLEDIVNRMETALNESRSYPSDIVEFRKQLEKQIEALANEGATA